MVVPNPPNLNYMRDITLLTPKTLGGTTIQYGYVLSNLCPALKGAIQAMLAATGHNLGSDWTWYQGSQACKVRDHANPCAAGAGGLLAGRVKGRAGVRRLCAFSFCLGSLKWVQVFAPAGLQCLLLLAASCLQGTQTRRLCYPSTFHGPPPSPVPQVTPAGGTRGYFYKYSLTMTSAAATDMLSYLNNAGTLNTFVAQSYTLCETTVSIESGGYALLQQTSPAAWPLDASVSAANCQRTPVDLGGK